MKTKLFILILLIAQIFYAQDITGTWYGTLDIRGQKLPLVIYISEKDKVYSSTFDSPLQGAKNIPIEITTFVGAKLLLSAKKVGFVFEGKLNSGKIEGNFSQNGMNLLMVLSRTKESTVLNRPQEPKPPFKYKNEEVTLKNEIEGNKLAGTLTVPTSFDQSKPILVMITGSGSQNRDEELFEHKPFLVIADDLAKKGIATLRLDDRGIGGSDKGKEGATSADFATDINSAVNYLIKKGYKNIGLIGHSEGGMIAPIVANSNKNVKFLVLLAAPGIPIDEVLYKQTYDIGKSSGSSEEDLINNEKLARKIFKFIQKYKGSNLKTDLKRLIIEDITILAAVQQNSEGMTPEEENAEIEKLAENQAKLVDNPWYMYFIKFKPDDYLSKIKVPVLALNGSLDLQVSAKENLAGIRKSLTEAENKKFEILEFPGMNHLFQTAKSGAISEYGEIEETISPKVLEKISSWILNLK